MSAHTPPSDLAAHPRQGDRVTTTEQTLAQQLAVVLVAVADHLRTHPHLPVVYVTPHKDIQIGGSARDGWTDEAGVLAWAETLPAAVITASRYNTDIKVSTANDVTIFLRANLSGIDVQVWDALDASGALNLEPGQTRKLTLDELRNALAPLELRPCDVCADPTTSSSTNCPACQADIDTSPQGRA